MLVSLLVFFSVMLVIGCALRTSKHKYPKEKHSRHKNHNNTNNIVIAAVVVVPGVPQAILGNCA